MIVAVAVAVAGLSAVAFAPTIAGAKTGRTTASDITTTTNAKSGTILEAGHVVYTLKAGKVACTAKCLKVWPPVLLPRRVKTATAAAPGVDASKLGTVAAKGGGRQITYSGKPLHWYSKDKKPGQSKGPHKDKWGKWSTVTVDVPATVPAPTATAAPTQPAPTSPPETAPASPLQTSPPQTAPPQTSPPPTAPPPTSPPAPRPTAPPTTSPSSGGVAF